eukprot:scaffold88575_cov69-Phaeocystis_antarctica.AAC.6
MIRFTMHTSATFFSMNTAATCFPGLPICAGVSAPEVEARADPPLAAVDMPPGMMPARRQVSYQKQEGACRRNASAMALNKNLSSLLLPHDKPAKLREPDQLDAGPHARARHDHLGAGGVCRKLSVQVAQLDDRVPRPQPGRLRGAASLHLAHDEQPATRLAAQPEAGRAVSPHVEAQLHRS